MTKKQYIDIAPKKIKEIADIRGCTEQCVRKALRFASNSTQAMLIRAWALNNGGTHYAEKESKITLQINRHER